MASTLPARRSSSCAPRSRSLAMNVPRPSLALPLRRRAVQAHALPPELQELEEIIQQVTVRAEHIDNTAVQYVLQHPLLACPLGVILVVFGPKALEVATKRVGLPVLAVPLVWLALTHPTALLGVLYDAKAFIETEPVTTSVGILALSAALIAPYTMAASGTALGTWYLVSLSMQLGWVPEQWAPAGLPLRTLQSKYDAAVQEAQQRGVTPPPIAAPDLSSISVPDLSSVKVPDLPIKVPDLPIKVPDLPLPKPEIPSGFQMPDLSGLPGGFSSPSFPGLPSFSAPSMPSMPSVPWGALKPISAPSESGPASSSSSSQVQTGAPPAAVEVSSSAAAAAVADEAPASSAKEEVREASSAAKDDAGVQYASSGKTEAATESVQVAASGPAASESVVADVAEVAAAEGGAEASEQAMEPELAAQ